jgi:hypothetical protein
MYVIPATGLLELMVLILRIHYEAHVRGNSQKILVYFEK